MRKLQAGICLALGLAATSFAWANSTATDTVAIEQTRWTVWGGELHFNWNRELLQDLGIALEQTRGRLPQGDEPHIDRIALREAGGLEINVLKGSEFGGFAGGQLQSRGGFLLSGSAGRIDLRDLSLRPQAGNPYRLDVIGSDGQAWFYIDRLMYKLEGGASPELAVRAMDLRVSPALAKRLGNATYSDWVVAGLSMQARVATAHAALAEPKGGRNRWPGQAAPNGGVFEADVFMETFSLQYTRKNVDADGPGGTDGRVVFTPSSTLRNNRGTGSLSESNLANPIVATVPSDPLGTSTVRYASDVAWHTKFSGLNEPYSNDQHPYLIWNVYRIDAQGRIDQIGRSGVKHAFLTINSSCDDNPSNGHILGRGCADVYGTGNNDSIGDLGPRSELVPATAQWGRCGSVYDADCNSARDNSSPCSNVGGSDCSSWAFRLQVQESAIDPAANPGAQYFAESWYVVRDDIDILNTMQSRPLGFSWTGSAWAVSNSSPLRLGPAVGRWVAPGSTAANERSIDIKSDEGNLRVAMKATTVAGANQRFDYAVMNLDFARAVTQGSEPNLRVLRNNGMASFELPFPSTASLSGTEFSDGDADPANDWTVQRIGERLVWSSPTSAGQPTNPLNWGTLFRFSVTTNETAQAGSVSLGIAEPGTPQALPALLLVPGTAVVTPDSIFSDSFETL